MINEQVNEDLKARNDAALEESGKYVDYELKDVAYTAFVNGTIWRDENPRPTNAAQTTQGISGRVMIPFLREQLLQQAHDILDTCEAMEKFAQVPERQPDEEPEQGLKWQDWQTEKPLLGERVVIDVDGCDPYFMTYFGQENEKVKRWLKLPE